MAHTPSRRDALVGLLGAGAALLAPHAAHAAVAPEPPAPLPTRQVGLLVTHVAGLPFHQAWQVEDHLAVGQPLVLRREPHNPHDPRAIEVLTADGTKLGYVPRRRNEAIANLMDAGAAVSGTITEVGAWRGRPEIRFAIDTALALG